MSTLAIVGLTILGIIVLIVVLGVIISVAINIAAGRAMKKFG